MTIRGDTGGTKPRAIGRFDDEDPRGELADDENPEWTDADFASARPLSGIDPAMNAALEAERARIATLRRPRGRPRKDRPKQTVSLRLDAEVLDALRAGGAGWHGRVNQTLRAALGLDVSETP